MKRSYLTLSMAALLSATACSKVPVGAVGIKVDNMGGDKGVNDQVLPTGWYWVGFTKSLYTFPTFMQNYVWSANKDEGSKNDESISFQTVEGLSVNADVGISYQVDPQKVPVLFQTYRQGLDEIRDVYLRNIVRDAIVTAASDKPIESVYGAGKAQLLKDVEAEVSAKVAPLGIKVNQLSWVGEFRLPETVVNSINAKIQATQQAQQRENEVATAKAEAQKAVAEAQGQADSVLIRARAQAQSNQILAQSLTPELVSYQTILKWNGVLPTYNGGGATPFVNISGKP
jgi:regulator of protease activity HflC (stomatin/prohibitin superfamily)